MTQFIASDDSIPDKAWADAAMDSLERTIPTRLKKHFVDFMFRARFWERQKLSLDSAIIRLNETLRREDDKRQFLKIAEIWAWMRHSGQHELFLAMARDLGYRVERIPTEALILETLTKIHQELDRASMASERLDELGAQLRSLGVGQQLVSDFQTSGGGARSFRFCAAEPETTLPSF